MDIRKRKQVRGLQAIELGDVLGAGTFGVVFKAMDNGRTVALKKVKMDRQAEGFPMTTIREMKILKSLHHENIVEIHDVIMYTKETDGDHDSKGIVDGDIFVVFEYVEFDLFGVLKSPSAKLTRQHIKSYMHQLLKGIEYMHKEGVLHRDIKTANILLTRDNVVKIADCGLSRLFHLDNRRMTREVCTLWYRSPELLMGVYNYGPEIDIWSIGVLFGELITLNAILPGDSVARQLELVLQLCGTPRGELARKYETMIDWSKYAFKTAYPPRIRRQFDGFDPLGISLLEKLLDMNPTTRITATAALHDTYFTHEPVIRELLPAFHHLEFPREGSVKEDAKRRETERTILEEKRAKIGQKKRQKFTHMW